MPIFRYTFKKIIVAPSTWVIFVLSVFCLGLAWVLPISLTVNNLNSTTELTKDLILTMFLDMWKLLSFTILIGLMLLIFIGVKATQIFRDEIDDGTLLILVSKPISRNRIWSEKWLAFQVTIVGYIFLTIFLAGILLVVPGIGKPIVYATLLPYMGILFAISLIFDLIFTSIVLLISLVLNSKATIAITVGFAALTNIFSQAIEPLVSIPDVYFQVSQANAVYHDFEKKVDGSEVQWLEEQGNDLQNYINQITSILQKVYDNNIPDVDYPDYYNPVLEKEEVTKIIAAGPTGVYTQDDIDLLNHIVTISGAFRQWKEQSYSELMTSVHVGNVQFGNPQPGDNGVNYSVVNMVVGINISIGQEQLNTINSMMTKKKVMRYLNIFYQLYYLWNGAWGDNDSLYIDPDAYYNKNDPYLISFVKTEDGYKVDTNKSASAKIINFPALVTVYLLLGLGLLGTSWYVFNRRDFA